MDSDENGERLDSEGDLMKGIVEIAEFIGESVRRTYYLAETGQIPTGKLGRLRIGSKRVIREYYRRLTSGKST